MTTSTHHNHGRRLRPQKADELTDNHTPEARFVFAFIHQWLVDALAGDQAAIRAMRQPTFDHWCEWIDINPNTIRNALNRRLS